jgi:selenocysteine lyase/cysteine desulfurase
MLDRRRLLTAAGLSLAGAAAGCATSPAAPVQTASAVPVAKPAPAPAPELPVAPAPVTPTPGNWAAVRGMFELDPQWVDMSAMLITAHPRPVRQAVELYRRELDRNPIVYLQTHNRRLQDASRIAAGQYLGVPHEQVALTGSTTEGVALVYHGLRLRPGQEILTTDQDYYVTHESLRLAAERSGAIVRRTPMYASAFAETEGALVERILAGVTPRTRVVALTWVHSSTGLKTPVRAVAERLRAVNADRGEFDQVLLAVDGVHGFGNQEATLDGLGCDFLMAGCHKWLFGPRGTGVVAASPRGWAALRPTIPSFIHREAYSAWIAGSPIQETNGSLLSPGGFKAFEHLWAMPAAFAIHQGLGQRAVAVRTAELAGQLKQGLLQMAHVTLHTPLSPALSAGIVSFDVAGLSPHQATARLRESRVLASVAPYARPHVRLTPSIRNSPAEVDFALARVRELAAA